MGEVIFSKMQYGKEVTKGTPVAATKVFIGGIQVPVDRKPEVVPEKTGKRLIGRRAITRQILADGITISSDDFQFDFLPLLFAGLKGGLTATETTPSQKDYAWDALHSLTGANNPDAITMEYGDDGQAYKIEYCMLKRFKLSGKIGAGESVKMEAEYFGKQITPGTFTAALVPSSGEIMLANFTKIFIDPAWASIGTTQQTTLLREWSLELITGVHPKFFANGSKVMSAHGEGVPDLALTLTFEGNASAFAQMQAFQAGTEKAISLQVTGSQIGTGTNYLFRADMYGTYAAVVPLASADQNNNLSTAVFLVHGDRQTTEHNFQLKCTCNVNAI